MKKTSTTIVKEIRYTKDYIIDNTASISAANGTRGLYDLEKRQLVSNLDNYNVKIKEENNMFFLTKVTNNSKETISIYDTLNKRMIVEDWEIAAKFDSDYNFFALKSSIDGKIHIFDLLAFRDNPTIFEKPFDNAALLASSYDWTYIEITENNKKGLYKHDKINKKYSFKSEATFDRIKHYSNIIVYTNDNQHHFEYDDDDKKSENFDEIRVEEKNNNIIYCKKNNIINVYNTEAKKLLLSIQADKIEYLFNPIRDNIDGEFYFKIKRNGKCGIVCSKTNYSQKGNGLVSEIIPVQYDDVINTYYDYIFFLRNNDKYGIYISGKILEPNYNFIDFLTRNYIALENNGYCDIVCNKDIDPLKPTITNCQIVQTFNNSSIIIYKKNNKYGLMFINEYDSKKTVVIPAEYDSIRDIEGYYFILEKNKKEGLVAEGKTIIPVEKDSITIHKPSLPKYEIEKFDTLYFSTKNEEQYELAKLHKNTLLEKRFEVEKLNTYNSIDFFNDIMVLKDQNYTYIYDYKEKLLNKLPASTSVIEIERVLEKPFENSLHEHDYYYSIDDVYYEYKEGTFSKVHTISSTLHVTTYQFTDENETIEISSYNQQALNEFCKNVDSKTEEEAKKYIDEMYKKSYGKDYPILAITRKRGKK